MTTYSICMKSGTGGWFDSDGCDLCLIQRVNGVIPRVSETISYHHLESGITRELLVTEVKYNIRHSADGYGRCDNIVVYGIPKNGWVHKE